MRRLRRWTIVVHRYLGLCLGAIFLLWFASGVGMMFTGGMPSLSEKARLDRLPVLDLSRIAIAPVDVPPVDRAGLVVTSVVGRAAYRLGPGHVVFADSGEPAAPAAVDVAAAFVGRAAADLQDEGVFATPDQWTLTERRRLPLRKFSVRDGPATEVYVSEADAEVVLATTRRTRTLAWLSAIPHWFYFAPLRTHASLWRQVVLAASALGSVLALAGVGLAVMQFRPRRPFRLAELTTSHPYSGWTRWHYVLGAIVGIFTLTWVVSGWLSMQPGNWAAPTVDGDRIQQALNQPAPGAVQPDPAAIAEWRRAFANSGAKEIATFGRLGATYLELRDQAQNGRPRLFDAATLRERLGTFPVGAIVQAVRDGTGGLAVLDVKSLDQYDSYYYAKASGRPLPVVRVKLADADDTWVYVDPARADVVAVYSWRGRLERWLYHGLHSLDVALLYRHPWLWAAVVGALCVGGTLLSATGLLIGGQRLLRRRRR